MRRGGDGAARTSVATIDARKESLERVLDEVAAVVEGGGIVVYPTDTVYSIGCDPYEADAIGKIYASKARPEEGPLSLYLASVQEALEYVGASSFATMAIRRTMPARSRWWCRGRRSFPSASPGATTASACGCPTILSPAQF